jgi:hypothetical protein
LIDFDIRRLAAMRRWFLGALKAVDVREVWISSFIAWHLRAGIGVEILHQRLHLRLPKFDVPRVMCERTRVLAMWRPPLQFQLIQEHIPGDPCKLMVNETHKRRQVGRYQSEKYAVRLFKRRASSLRTELREQFEGGRSDIVHDSRELPSLRISVLRFFLLCSELTAGSQPI